MRFSLAKAFVLLTLLSIASVFVPGAAIFLVGFSPSLLGAALFMVADHCDNETCRMAGIIVIVLGIFVSIPLMNMVSQLSL